MPKRKNRSKDTLEMFHQWSFQNDTHMQRSLNILERQIKNQRDYVELFHKYPANSVEFKVEVEKLYRDLGNLLEEFRENTADHAHDFELFQKVLKRMRKDIDKLPEDWGKEHA